MSIKVAFRTYAPARLPIMEIGVGDAPAGVVLADVDVKYYKGLLEKSQGTDAKIKEKKQLTLADGTPAGMALISWKFQKRFSMLTKWVFVAVHDSYDDNPEVPQSLKFK